MSNILWDAPGTALFDFYSMHHFVWFMAIGLLLFTIFRKYCWIGAIVIAVGWEILEQWAAYNALWFPLAGKELWINKVIGDPISNCLGFLTALFLINIIRKRENETTKQISK